MEQTALRPKPMPGQEPEGAAAVTGPGPSRPRPHAARRRGRRLLNVLLASFAGRPLVVGPGVTWTLRLPWEGERIADREAPPGLAFHVLDDSGRLTSHFRVVP